MTREELIDHLEHLERYTHYSEDAPALREVIEMLKCSEMPNSSEERTNKRTETHACDCISRRESTMGQVNESAQSTNDLIIRKAEIDPKDAVSAIENLSSAQLEPHWIPCSERLPKKHGESYLVTISDGAVYTTTLQWDANGKRWYLSFFNDGNILVDFIDDVIAWLPLPEPYQAERWE